MQSASSKQATLAVLENPLSGRNSRQPGALKQICKSADIPWHSASTPEALQKYVRELLVNPPDILAVSGGDGTISAVLNVFEGHPDPTSLPALALLCGGSTNMIQRELGLSGNPTRALQNVLNDTRAGITPGRIQQRSPFGVLSDDGQPEQFGFFFAAGAMSRILQFCQEAFSRKAINGVFIESLALLSVFSRLFILKKATGDIFHHDDIRWARHTNGQKKPSDWHGGPSIFIYLTSLNRLLLGFNPRGRHNALKLVTYKHPFTRRGLLTYLLSRGGSDRKKTQEVEHDSSDKYSLCFKGQWVLDGEFYGHPDKDSKLKIRTCQPLPFFIM